MLEGGKSRVEVLKLEKGLGIASPWPALLLERESALLVADLHIGLEHEHERMGVHVPTSVFPRIVQSILVPARELGCSNIVILGDVKHEFGVPTEAEWWGVRRLVRELRAAGCALQVVRGNHDNYIISVLKELGVELHQQSLELGELLLTHGHLELPQLTKCSKHIVMGHEHPAVTLKDDVGFKHRFKAFLIGRVHNAPVTVLPAVSPLAYGTDVNETPQEHFLSPILREAPLDTMTPYAIEAGVSVKKFPPLRELWLV